MESPGPIKAVLAAARKTLKTGKPINLHQLFHTVHTLIFSKGYKLHFRQSMLVVAYLPTNNDISRSAYDVYALSALSYNVNGRGEFHNAEVSKSWNLPSTKFKNIFDQASLLHTQARKNVRLVIRAALMLFREWPRARCENLSPLAASSPFGTSCSSDYSASVLELADYCCICMSYPLVLALVFCNLPRSDLMCERIV